MKSSRRTALTALAAAGLLWGTTVPLTKVALEVLPPAWLTVLRFATAGLVLLAVFRPRLRGAATPSLLAWGALGYGVTIVVQNAGIARTSVSHAALLIGTVPVTVAVIAAVAHRSRIGATAWSGFAVSLAGVVLIAGTAGGGSTLAGDGLVLLSVVIGSAFTVAQARLLRGRDPIAVSAAQFLVAAAVAAPLAALMEGAPPVAVPSVSWPLVAVLALVTVGTVLPYTLFAYGQTGVRAETAGAFLNLETLVGATVGALVFGDPFGPAHAAGAVAIVVGIALAAERRPRALRDVAADAGSVPAAGVPAPREVRARQLQGQAF